MKTIKILFLLLVIIATSNICLAQYSGDAGYHQRKETNANNAAREKIRDNMYSKPGVAPSINYGTNNTSLEDLFPSKEKKAEWEKARQERVLANQQAKQREIDENLRWEQYYRDVAENNATEKRNFIQSNINDFNGNNNFTLLDIKIFVEEHFYYTKKSKDIASEEAKKYIAASKIINKLNNAKDGTHIDSLMTWVWQTRHFPDLSLRHLKKIQTQFPAEKSFTEKYELLILAYYFGANSSYATNKSQYTYPLCGFEIMNDEQKTKILDRFEELESIYPEIALKAAGECRAGFNIFHKYATSNMPLKNKTEERRLDFLYKTLITPQPARVLPQGGFSWDTWKVFADNYLRKTAIELKLLYPNFVKEITTEKWLEVSKAYDINVDYIAWAFRDDGDMFIDIIDNKLSKKYPNLSAARKQAFKKEDGNTTIVYKNRDKYVGEVKNGKPNGTGKFTSAQGDTSEGTFKNGVLHGKGKTYRAFTTESDNYYIRNEYQGDIYEGDFDNGKREGVGTLYSNPNEYKYVGEWKEGKKHGQGEESWTNEKGVIYKLYKGGFKNGMKDGQAVETNDDGEIYTGGFEEGRQNGKGVLKYPNGTTLECLAGKGGGRYGQVIITNADGYKMTYRNDFKKWNSERMVDKKYYNSSGKEITEIEYKLKHNIFNDSKDKFEE